MEVHLLLFAQVMDRLSMNGHNYLAGGGFDRTIPRIRRNGRWLSREYAKRIVCDNVLMHILSLVDRVDPTGSNPAMDNIVLVWSPDCYRGRPLYNAFWKRMVGFGLSVSQNLTVYDMDLPMWRIVNEVGVASNPRARAYDDPPHGDWTDYELFKARLFKRHQLQWLADKSLDYRRGDTNKHPEIVQDIAIRSEHHRVAMEAWEREQGPLYDGPGKHIRSERPLPRLIRLYAELLDIEDGDPEHHHQCPEYLKKRDYLADRLRAWREEYPAEWWATASEIIKAEAYKLTRKGKAEALLKKLQTPQPTTDHL